MIWKTPLKFQLIPENSKLSVDEVLRLYLETPQEEECAKYLDLLIEKHSLPIIERILRAKVRGSAGFGYSEEDFEDLRNESCLRLIEKLEATRNSGGASQIRDFESYTATVTTNVWNSFLNRSSPNRQSLKNKIRYALDKDQRFEVWHQDSRIYCSLAPAERQISRISADELTSLIQDECKNFRKLNLAELMHEILRLANAAFLVNDIVSVVAKLWAVEDRRDISLDGFSDGTLSANGDRQKDMEMRFELKHIWREIQDLPVNQRIALLYNLRDEKGHEMLLIFFIAEPRRLVRSLMR